MKRPWYLSQTREDFRFALEELLEVGPHPPALHRDTQPVWVQGVHLSGRRTLKHWLSDDLDVVEHILPIGVTITPEEIRGPGCVKTLVYHRYLVVDYSRRSNCYFDSGFTDI